MPYFAYILKCSDGTFYAGSTDNLDKRLHAHNHLKSGAHYTKIRRPVTLHYFKKVKTFALARRHEAEIKRMTREEKSSLIAKSRKLAK